jgi:hypothetical protein
MRRDIDLIRLILMEIETGTAPEGLNRHTEKEIVFHSALAIEAGLLQGQVLRNETRGDSAIIERLTWAGHDFLDSARDETNWNKAKAMIAQAGGAWTFEIVKSLLVELAKKSLLP